ncbi:Chitinase 1 [Apophysomyces sp. BC1021]|nr:Chitinase 1 [Apophysomyces sp. BC1021]
MKSSFHYSALALLAAVVAPLAVRAFDAAGHNNLLLYWGQNSAGATGAAQKDWQQRLSYYCEDNTVDVFTLSFLYEFGGGRPTAFDLSNASNNCTGLIEGTQLLNCPQMEEDIKQCQSKGKKILLSMGGATGSYGLDTDKDGETLADDLWSYFGGGSSKIRPFGSAVIDGFDLDLEGGASKGFVGFVNRMRNHYDSDKSKQYYMSAAPQCPFPDAYMGGVLDSTWFDFVSVNNKEQFNYATWDNWARTKSQNKNVRLFVGVPGSTSAAGSGYVPLNTLTTTIGDLQKQYPSFGGVMMWDASQAYINKDGSPNYATAVSQVLKSEKKSRRSQPTTTNPGRTTTTTFIGSTTSASTTTPSHTTSVNPLPPMQGSPCANENAMTCSGKDYAQCVYGRWVVRSCGGNLVCQESPASGVLCNYPQTRRLRRRFFRK